MPWKRKKRHLGGDEFGLPLFVRKAPSGEVDARDSVRRPPEGASRLSMAHNDTVPFVPEPPKPKTFSVYKGASLGRTPGVNNAGASSNSKPPACGKKQMIERFSQSSRNNLKNKLAMIRTDAVLYTMCLSLPGYVEHFTHGLVKLAFLKFLKRLTAKCSRDARFREVSGVYKQELQRRLELHFHLVFAGVTPENLDVVWNWCADQWIDCVMAIPGMPREIVLEETRKMQAVHLFAGTKRNKFEDSNFQLLRGDFHSYFAKYLGKQDEAHVSEFPIPGRWWGFFNKAYVPFGELREIVLPERVAVHSHRVARRIRQARADDAKYRALCRKFDRMDGKRPKVSRFELEQAVQRWNRHAGMLRTEEDVPEFFRRVRGGRSDSGALGFLLDLHAAKHPFRDLVSGYRFPAAMKYSAVTLTGKHVPEMMVRILHYAGARALRDREVTPF